MTFDNGTWWLALALLGLITGGLTYLVKRTVFGRVDRLADDIERIKQDYTPRRVHDKDHDATQAEIKKITENYLTKESLLRAGNFVQNNGGVLRPLNILSHKYNRLGNLQSLLAGEGVAEDEFLDSVNFLASEGYIHLRLISTREPALLADHEYTELEGKLTSRGKRLLKGGIEDNMIEV